MATKTKTTLTTFDALSDDVKAVMDRAVRAARSHYWCSEFSRVAGTVFNVPDSDVVDSDGTNCSGFDREGFDKDGRNNRGYNRDGYNIDGWNKDGFNKDGFDRSGLNKDGVDANGRDKYRFDANGYDSEGYDWNGSRRRADRAWYASQAAKPETDFRYDGNAYERPKAEAKKTAATTKPTRRVPLSRGY